MSNLVGAIKLGTTTVSLRVGRLGSDGRPEVSLVRKDVVCLGRGLETEGLLRGEDMAAVLRLLNLYLEELERRRAVGVLTGGGYALRRAANAGAFIDLIHDHLGLSVLAADGREEGRITYDGVAYGSSAQVLLVDVGGGSTELVSPSGAVSVDIGALTLSRRQPWADPPAPVLSLMRETADHVLAGQAGLSRLARATHGLGEGSPGDAALAVVAAGGTANQLLKLVRGAPPGEATNHPVRLAELETCLEMLARMSIEERKAYPGLDPARAELIVPGLCLLGRTLVRLGASEFSVTGRDTGFGLWLMAAQGYRGRGYSGLGKGEANDTGN